MRSAFGVEHPIAKAGPLTAKEKKRVAGASAVGATIGGLYGGPVLAGAAQVGGYAAGAKATNMHRAANSPGKVDPKMASNPAYSKWQKTQNLADRASTPGEKQAAQAAADRMKAKHGFAPPPKAKPLGRSYKVLRRVQRLTNPKTAMAAGIGTAAAMTGTAAGFGSRKNIRREHDERTRRAAARARRQAAA